MKHNIITSLLLFMLFAITGCKKYLQVDPKSTVSENELFTSEVGFQQALIGVYSHVASRELYGDNLSMGFVSALAQNYSAVNLNFIFKNAAALNFNTQEVINRASAIWANSYESIAGLNNIIGKIDERKSSFTGDNYALIKGEALGLRAYLHFDLLRLYGPNYITGDSKKSIPYRKSINSLSQVPSTTEEAVGLALADLNEAGLLLSTIDPILGANKNRRFYMNYLAVKALQARIYLFKGDKASATAAALTVVNSGKFSFVTNAQISAGAGTRDRLFSNEQVMSLRVRTMIDWTETLDGYFKAAGAAGADLALTATNFNTLYESASGGSTDFRSVYLLENDGTVKYSSKYWQTYNLGTGVPATERLDQTVPLIRLSEMYYILAETAATPEQGVVYLNMVRANRGIAALTVPGIAALTLTNEITKEYQKEFYGEGQLFYYYKRNGFSRMQFSTKNLTESNYILPIPDAELEFNPNYN